VDSVLKAEGLHKRFGSSGGSIEVLRGVDLEVRAGELVAVAGNSGSGKSTLLHVLGGIMHPDAGRVTVAGADVYGLSEKRRAALRNGRVGYVYQFHHLLPEFTALENVMLPALIAGRGRHAAAAGARALLATLGVADREGHRPGELSGGEQQRVAVARALVNAPEVVLADEPSGNLDEEAAGALHALLESLSAERGVALVVATHSPALARRAHRCLLLRSGTLMPLGRTEGWM
jgi:lipoprotein-releasing system ATP-binding protein